MLSRIINFSIKNKFIILLFTSFLVGIGLFSVTQLSIGSVPDITNNQVQIITTSPHLSTQEIEQFITYPIEMEMTNIPGVEEIRSISRFGLSVITIVFDESMGTYLPRQLISERLEAASEFIPEGFGTPEMGPISTGLGEIYHYTLEVEPDYKDKYSIMDLRSIQDWIIKRQLSGLKGIAEVNSWGGQLKEYEVALQTEMLNSMGVSTWDVLDALEKNNSVAGGGYIEKNQQAYFIRGEGLIQNLEDIENIVVENRNGTPILIRDIAKVGLGHATRFGAITANGEGEKVMGQILMLKGENSKKVVENIQIRIDEISKNLPEGVYINPFLDASELINKTTKTITENLIIGILIVIFVVVLLIGNMRSGIVVASIIPLSLLFTLTMMYVFGIDANLMSLGAIDFGIILDGAVIIVEYIAFQITKRHKDFAKLSKVRRRALNDEITYQGTSRMMNSAIFGQLIILIVFIPILSLSGVEGKMFKPMALTFCFALIGAMILCFTYVPAVSSLILKPDANPEKNFSFKVMNWLGNKFEPFIRWALHHRVIVIALAIVALISSLLVFRTMGGEFIPSLDEGDYVIQPVLKTGTSLTETMEITTKIEQILMQFPEVDQIVSRIGAAEVPTDPMSMEESDIMITLHPIKEWTSAKTKEELAEVFEEALSVIPGMELEFSQPIEMRFNELITGVQADIAVKIYGEDLEVLNRLAQEVKTNIENIKGVGDITAEKIDGLPEMNVKFNRKNIARYGLNITDLNTIITMGFAGQTAGQVFEGEERYNLVLRLDKTHRNSIEDLQNLYIDTHHGKVPLRELAEITYKTGAAQISRENTYRQTFVGVNVRNRDLQSVADDIQKKIEAHIHLPVGYKITYGGQFENLQKAKARLAIAVPIALLLIFILLYFAFKSVKEALIIYTAIPLAAVGGIYFLWVRDLPFSISAGVGFIALFGIVVLNGIILVDYFKQLIKQGKTDADDIVISGTKSRLRAILLTATCDALGFLPMAISTGAGAEVQRPLATVVIGGLITSTLLTLIVLPVLYAQFCIPKNGSKPPRTQSAKPVPVILSLLLLFFLAVPTMAQTPTYSIDDLEQILLENSLSLQVQKKAIEKSEINIKTAWDFDKTSVYYEWDETNIDAADQIYKVWGIQQDFKFPSIYSAKKKVKQKQLRIEQIRKDQITQQLLYELHQAYQEYLLIEEKKKTLQKLNELYTQFEKAAHRKFELGESTYLEKITATSKLKQLQLVLENNQKKRTGVLQRIQEILYLQDPINLEIKELEMMPSLEIISDAKIEEAPILQLQSAQTTFKESELKLERRQLLPDWNIGYFQSHSSLQSKGLYGYQIGLKIPLFFGAQKNEIRAAKLEVEESDLKKQELMNQLNSRWEQKRLSLQETERSLSYYNQEGKELAKQLLHMATRAYQEGEIDFLQYVQTIEHAQNIQLEHLEQIYLHNTILLQLTYHQL